MCGALLTLVSVTFAFACSPQTAVSEIYSTHFTLCQKPWICYVGGPEWCRVLHDEWFKIREELEVEKVRVCEEQSDGAGGARLRGLVAASSSVGHLY